MYHPDFLDHLQSPRGQGRLAGATHRGAAENDACGDRLWLDLRVEAGVIREARMRVQGCPGAIAVGSALATVLPGRPASADAIDVGDLVTLLGEVPRAKRHALRLGLDTLRDALGAAAG